MTCKFVKHSIFFPLGLSPRWLRLVALVLLEASLPLLPRPCPAPSAGAIAASCAPSGQMLRCTKAFFYTQLKYFYYYETFPPNSSIKIAFQKKKTTKNTQDWSPLEWTGWISLQSSLDGYKHFSAHTSLFLSVSCKCGPLCLQALNLAAKKNVTSLTFFVANIFK